MNTTTPNKVSRKRKRKPESNQKSKPASSREGDNFCCICLSQPIDRCQAVPCTHVFCFLCLLNWSKINPHCPLCKKELKSIIFNAKDDGSYDEYSPTTKITTLESNISSAEPDTENGNQVRIMRNRDSFTIYLMSEDNEDVRLISD